MPFGNYPKTYRDDPLFGLFGGPSEDDIRGAEDQMRASLAAGYGRGVNPISGEPRGYASQGPPAPYRPQGPPSPGAPPMIASSDIDAWGMGTADREGLIERNRQRVLEGKRRAMNRRLGRADTPVSAGPTEGQGSVEPVAPDPKSMTLAEKLDYLDAVRQREDEERLSRISGLLEGGSAKNLPGASPRLQARASLAERNIDNYRRMSRPDEYGAEAKNFAQDLIRERGRHAGAPPGINPFSGAPAPRMRGVGANNEDIGRQVALSSGLRQPPLGEFEGIPFVDWEFLHGDVVSDGSLSSVRGIGADHSSRVARREATDRRHENRRAYYDNQAQARSLMSALSGLSPEGRARVISEMERSQRDIELARIQAEVNKYASEMGALGGITGPNGTPGWVGDYIRGRGGGDGSGRGGAVGPEGTPPPARGEDGVASTASVSDWLMGIEHFTEIANVPPERRPTSSELMAVIRETGDRLMPRPFESEAEEQLRREIYRRAVQAHNIWYKTEIDDSYGYPGGAPGTDEWYKKEFGDSYGSPGRSPGADKTSGHRNREPLSPSEARWFF